MYSIKRILCTKLECGLFNQIALFSAAGLSLSLMLAMVCDLQLAGQWL